jgi:hypothetical protein
VAPCTTSETASTSPGDEAVARRYAALRAGATAKPQLFKISLEPGELGRVLDLTKDTRWLELMRRPAVAGGPTYQALIEMANENYGRVFRVFLAQHNLNIAEFDAVIGPRVRSRWYPDLHP